MTISIWIDTHLMNLSDPSDFNESYMFYVFLLLGNPGEVNHGGF